MFGNLQITDLDNSPSERQLSRVVSLELLWKQTPKDRTLVSPTCTNFESLFTHFLLARKCPGIHSPDYEWVWAGFLWVWRVWGEGTWTFHNLVPRAFPSKNGWGPTHFLREKPWGRGWTFGNFSVTSELLGTFQSLLGIELQFFKVGIKRSSNSSAGSQGLEPSWAHQ